MENKISIGHKDALIIVDVQRDFLPGGALPVPDGNKIIPFLNDYIKTFKKLGSTIFATRDWHPPNHLSFKTEGGSWPAHCIQDTEGAEFGKDLKLPSTIRIISKGMNPDKESYSGFHDTKLADILIEEGISKVFIGGIATEYCVKNTVLDALKLKFDTILLIDAIRGINENPNEVQDAIREMLSNGAKEATLINFPDPIAFPEPTLSASDGYSEKSLTDAEMKKKARMRSKGQRVPTEK